MSYRVRIDYTVDTIGEAKLFEEWANNRISQPDKYVMKEVTITDLDQPVTSEPKGEANDQDT